LNKDAYNPAYGAEKDKLIEFITKFEDVTMAQDQLHGKFKYMTRMQGIANRKEKIINIELQDLHTHF
jgi:hypothetical protein